MKKLFYLAVSALTLLILFRAEYVMEHIKETLFVCFEIIIPSLFPFFVCSGLLIYSGFSAVIAKYAQHIMRPLFNVAPSGAAAFVLGIISGFPTGAVCVRDLYKCGNLSKSEAERLLAFCNNSGPLFIIGSIGTAIYSKPVYGVMLYTVHIAASIAVGIIFRNYGKNHHNSPLTRINTNEMPIPQVISMSIENASKNILTVCFSVIFFATAAQTVLELIPMPTVLNSALSGLFEFSSGVIRISELDTPMFEKLVLTSFIMGFSGLCVCLQVMAVTSDIGLNLMPYILGKFLHGTIAAFLTALILAVSRIEFNFRSKPPFLSVSFFVSAVLVLTSTAVLLIITLTLKIKQKHRLRNNT